MIDKKTKILRIAQEQFSKFGITKTTVDEIAKIAHIAKGTIYHYFQMLMLQDVQL